MITYVQCDQYSGSIEFPDFSSLQPKHTTTPQPFYGPFFRDHPGEPVPEENLWTL